MLAYDNLFNALAEAEIDLPREHIECLTRGAFSDKAHGKLATWREILAHLPLVATRAVDLNGDAVAATADTIDRQSKTRLRELLLQLSPWRKGPFDLFGIRIDAEWQSQLKWNRVRNKIAPLAGRRVLDVGCGNGYYALRMHGQGARFVLGIDPTINHVVQFLAVQKYLQQECVHVLPLRLHQLPMPHSLFDTAFSMGVLYHQRQPLEHLAQLRDALLPGGELVLETLIVPGEERSCVTPVDRYARMRNVWHLPSITELQTWLETSGFSDCRVADISETGTDEQRATEWMPFESLQQALDPANSRLTIEGLPRPTRAVLLASRS